MPIQPTSSAAEENSPHSSMKPPEIGRPITISLRISAQSGRQKRPSTRYFLNGAARIADPDRGRAHRDIHDRGREPGAEQVEARQAERAVDQRIGEQRVERDRGERDPQRRLRAIDRTHEIAQRDEAPRRDHRPGQARAGSARRAPAVSGDCPAAIRMLLAPQLRDVDRNADHHRGPQPDAQRAAHQARLARAERLRGERRDGGHESHAEHEADEQDQMREPDGRDGAVAELADQREVGRHHRDLAELRERDRPARAGSSRRSRCARRRASSGAAAGTRQ